MNVLRSVLVVLLLFILFTAVLVAVSVTIVAVGLLALGMPISLYSVGIVLLPTILLVAICHHSIAFLAHKAGKPKKYMISVGINGHDHKH